MRDEHVIDLLDESRFAGLGDDERTRVETHAGECEPCRRAYDAFRLSVELLGARAAETVEPSPFFQTRVMAAIRERRAASERNSFARMWRAAGALVSAMTAAVVLLAGATILNHRSSGTSIASGAEAIYSREWDELQSTDPASDISDDQLFEVIYDAEGVYGQGR